MRQFLRTAAGKTLLFLSCGLCGIVLAASIAVAALLVEMDFYTREESEIQEEINASLLSDEGWQLVWQLERGELTEKTGETDDFTWQIESVNGKVKLENNNTKAKWQYSLYYEIYQDEDDEMSIYQVDDSHIKQYVSDSGKYDIVYFNLGKKLTGKYELTEKLVQLGYGLRYAVYVILSLAFVLGLLSFVTLMSAAGRRPDSSEICPGPFYSIPSDLFTVLCVISWCSILGLVLDMAGGRIAETLIVLAAGVLLAGNTFLGFCMSIAVRVKKKTLWNHTVIGAAFRLCKRMFRGMWNTMLSFPMIWKVFLGAVILSFLEFLGIIAFSYDTGNLALLWFIEKLILLPIIFYGALMIKKLQKGAKALAEGDLSYQIDTSSMRGDFRKQGEDLNSIADGMSRAVEKQIKSERMKTELITNVSHDIKTPLTSIINYADLIGKEQTENKKITEYAEVLVRQSVRLKRLIEDLVEASKASTGNLEVNLVPCDASVFLTQAGGEYEEKLQNAELTLVTSQPEHEIKILADGRRMWRVFDNLMNNICKYALAGTRVYLSLEQIGNNAVIVFKNTSREALNISEEELMERFVRGDRSRTTEGNGLGLSIARSLTELQKGTLTIKIDGDLFKAILTFPII